MAITDKSDVRCFGPYLINIFRKFRKAERDADVMLKQDYYCLSVTAQDLDL